MMDFLLRPGLKGYFIYFFLPLIVCLTLIGMYFFGPLWAQEIVAPRINREFGVLENLELLVVLLVIIIALNSWRRSSGLFRKFFFLVIIVSVFDFLEEIEYGLNYVEYFKGVVESLQEPMRSVHSISGVTALLKNLVYLGFGLFFICTTFFPEKIPELVRPFLPSRMILLTILALLIVSNTAWYINYVLKITGTQSLYGNISEFEEIVIYYIFFLYLRELRGRALQT